MALIKCAECGKEFSDKANACPNCACPIDEVRVQDVEEKIKRGKIKEYSELTKREKESIRLCMKNKGELSPTIIALNILSVACIFLGFFFAFWIFFLVVGFCLSASGYYIQTQSEKKFYYKYPNSIKTKETINQRKTRIIRGIVFTIIWTLSCSLAWYFLFYS